MKGVIKMEQGGFTDVSTGFNWGLTENRLDELIIWHNKEADKNGLE